MEDQIVFLRTLIDELRNQRDEWREQSINRGVEIMRLRARNAVLERLLAEYEESDVVYVVQS